MAVSNWWLYIGAFLCCTGLGVVPGAIFIAYWAVMRLENVKPGNSYTENNYSINIQDFHGGNGGSGGGNNNQSPKSNPKPKTKTKKHLKAIAYKTVPMSYVSPSSLQRGK